MAINYLVYSRGSYGTEFIGGTCLLTDARFLAKNELGRCPDRQVSITCRFTGKVVMVDGQPFNPKPGNVIL